eukprot:4042613-Pleurochrysis_carterae.AAC.1
MPAFTAGMLRGLIPESIATSSTELSVDLQATATLEKRRIGADTLEQTHWSRHINATEWATRGIGATE